MQTKKIIIIVLTILLAVVALFFLYLIYQEKQINNQKNRTTKNLEEKTRPLTREEKEIQSYIVQGKILEVNKDFLKVELQKDLEKWISIIRIIPETEIITMNLNKKNSILEIGDIIIVSTKEKDVTNNPDFQASRIIQTEDF